MTKIALTNYLLKVNVYEKKDLDFFTFLVLQIASKKDLNEKLKDVLLDCYITPSLFYLFEKAFYDCLDDNLIVSSTDDFENVNMNEMNITESGSKALENNYALSKIDTKEVNISIDPKDDSLIPFKDTDKVKEYELIEKTYSDNEINTFVNNKRIELFGDKTNNYYYDCEVLRVLPTII